MAKIRKNKIGFNIYFKILKKTFLFNIFLAIVLVALFNLNSVNKKKFEVYTYLNIDSNIYRSYNINYDQHLNEIYNLFEGNLNYISSLLNNENERLSISANRITTKLLKSFEIRSLVRVKKFEKNLFEENLSKIIFLTEKEYRNILASRTSTLIKSEQIGKQIIKEEINDLNYSDSLNMDYTEYLNAYINKKLLIKGHQALLDQTKLINHNYTILTSEPKMILSSILIFIISIITFNFILSIYIIGKEKL